MQSPRPRRDALKPALPAACVTGPFPHFPGPPPALHGAKATQAGIRTRVGVAQERPGDPTPSASRVPMAAIAGCPHRWDIARSALENRIFPRHTKMQALGSPHPGVSLRSLHSGGRGPAQGLVRTTKHRRMGRRRPEACGHMRCRARGWPWACSIRSLKRGLAKEKNVLLGSPPARPAAAGRGAIDSLPPGRSGPGTVPSAIRFVSARGSSRSPWRRGRE